jgi:hypothetical protein
MIAVKTEVQQKLKSLDEREIRSGFKEEGWRPNGSYSRFWMSKPSLQIDCQVAGACLRLMARDRDASDRSCMRAVDIYSAIIEDD